MVVMGRGEGGGVKSEWSRKSILNRMTAVIMLAFLSSVNSLLIN